MGSDNTAVAYLAGALRRAGVRDAAARARLALAARRCDQPMVSQSSAAPSGCWAEMDVGYRGGREIRRRLRLTGYLLRPKNNEDADCFSFVIHAQVDLAVLFLSFV
jgi:hypothetical protein